MSDETTADDFDLWADAPQPAEPKELQPAEAVAEASAADEDTQDMLDALAELNPQELRFLAAYSKDGIVKAACEASGYKTNPLPRNAKLRAALALIQRNVAARIGYGVAQAIRELVELGREARGDKQFMAAVRAVETKAKIAGLLSPDAQNTVPSLTINITGVNPPPYAAIDGESEVIE